MPSSFDAQGCSSDYIHTEPMSCALNPSFERDSLDDIEAYFEQLAYELDGDFDGWEAAVLKT